MAELIPVAAVGRARKSLSARAGMGAWFWLLVVLMAALAACGRATPETRLSEFGGSTMGTTYTVKVVDLPADVNSGTLAEDIHAALERVNSLMSTYLEDSELSRFNRSRSMEWMPVSAETHDVILEALRVSRMTGGAFDVTVGPLVNLWGFGPDAMDRELPDEVEILRAKARTGYEQLELRATPPALRKRRADIYVDLSAIAKGYAVDQVANLLETKALERYLVEVGGELRAAGLNHHDRPWAIAVERPQAGERTVQSLIRLAEGGIATSGGYRNFFLRDGRSYSHTIDPRTGYPVQHDLASVSVVESSAMVADALATAFLVLGPDEGFALALRENVAALFVLRAGSGFAERTTPGFGQYLSEE